MKIRGMTLGEWLIVGLCLLAWACLFVGVAWLLRWVLQWLG